MELFYDVETTGFISGKKSYDDLTQAWAIQCAAILSNKDSIIDSMDVIIKPNGRTEMNPYAEKVHGISLERAEKEGIPEEEALKLFAQLQVKSDKKICHNASFDSKYLYQMMQRNMDVLTDVERSSFYLEDNHFCTMKNVKIIKFCNLKNKTGRPKWPKLSELYNKLFDKEFENAHNALADVKALRDCYYELIAREII